MSQPEEGHTHIQSKSQKKLKSIDLWSIKMLH